MPILPYVCAHKSTFTSKVVYLYIHTIKHAEIALFAYITDITHANGTGTAQEHNKNVYLCNIVTTNLHIYALKSANSAVIPLINPLTLYHQTSCDLYKYTEVKISSYHRKLITEQKFSPPVLPIYENSNSLNSFLSPSISGTKRQHL